MCLIRNTINYNYMYAYHDTYMTHIFRIIISQLSIPSCRCTHIHDVMCTTVIYIIYFTFDIIILCTCTCLSSINNIQPALFLYFANTQLPHYSIGFCILSASLSSCGLVQVVLLDTSW